RRLPLRCGNRRRTVGRCVRHGSSRRCGAAPGAETGGTTPVYREPMRCPGAARHRRDTTPDYPCEGDDRRACTTGARAATHRTRRIPFQSARHDHPLRALSGTTRYLRLLLLELLAVACAAFDGEAHADGGVHLLHRALAVLTDDVTCRALPAVCV